jgi:hypothetical protein
VGKSVMIAYRGKDYEIGRGKGCYAIWLVGAPRSQPFEQWSETPEGWYSAWSRFTGLEVPATIVPVEQATAPVASERRHVVIAAALLGTGVALGVIGLFPDYVMGSSLTQQASELVVHVMYLVVWSASALLIMLGGSRLRVGALLGIGTGIVTFGLFFADAGTAIAGGAHLMGAGLVFGLIGWLLCTAGSTVAFRIHSSDAPAKPRRHQVGVIPALVLAGFGAAAAFAPSWDSFTLVASTGTTQSVTAGNAFSNPAPVIAGDVAVMVAFAVVVIAAALWRPTVRGAALLAGAIVPMAAQAIAALVEWGQGTSPAQLGISPAVTRAAGLTVRTGVTPAFWFYCAFVLLLIVLCVRMLLPPRPFGLSALRSTTPPGVHASSEDLAGFRSPSGTEPATSTGAVVPDSNAPMPRMG